MPLKRMIAGVGAALVFATGVAAAALADSPPPTTTDTTTTTSTTEPITTTSTSTSSSTSTETLPAATTTTSTQTTTETATTTRPTTTRPARPRLTPHGLRRGASPAGTIEKAKAAARSSKKHRKHRKHRRASKPLKVTPPLGQRSFVFPVVGTAGYGDSYGEVRSDVHGGWHHGDDIFAPLGAPVVAVASGTINRVGWERVGGWRLWVRDSAADEFYYAHLSGYTRSVFHSRSVKAGQVIGFVGDTGDAFGGMAHLHFEIHPRQLLRLHYDGAVDPTTYLDDWTRLKSVRVPLPMHPRLPKQAQLRSEASQVFRQLLVARSLATKPQASRSPQHDVPLGADVPSPPQPLLTRVAAPAPLASPRASLLVPLLGGLSALAALVAATLLGRLWQRRGGVSAVREAANDEHAL
jgi:murein DD-endopeptidase MepM/ murein hydrolase activator NlpD